MKSSAQSYSDFYKSNSANSGSNSNSVDETINNNAGDEKPSNIVARRKAAMKRRLLRLKVGK